MKYIHLFLVTGILIRLLGGEQALAAQEAIVVTLQASIHERADIQSPVLMQTKKGQKLKVGDNATNGWYRVSLPKQVNGLKTGWIQAIDLIVDVGSAAGTSGPTGPGALPGYMKPNRFQVFGGASFLHPTAVQEMHSLPGGLQFGFHFGGRYMRALKKKLALGLDVSYLKSTDTSGFKGITIDAIPVMLRLDYFLVADQLIRFGFSTGFGMGIIHGVFSGTPVKGYELEAPRTFPPVATLEGVFDLVFSKYMSVTTRFGYRIGTPVTVLLPPEFGRESVMYSLGSLIVDSGLSIEF